MEKPYKRGPLLLYLVDSLVGIAAGIYHDQELLALWYKHDGFLPMNLSVIRIAGCILGVIIGLCIAYALQDLYCTASIGPLPLLLSVVLTEVAFIVISAFIIVIISAIYFVFCMAGLYFVAVLLGLIRPFDD